MRVDLLNSPYRPWPIQLLIKLLSIGNDGMIAPPPLFFSYRIPLLRHGLGRYIAQAGSHPGPWSHGEDELIGSFVSNLNSCHF